MLIEISMKRKACWRNKNYDRIKFAISYTFRMHVIFCDGGCILLQ